MVALTAIFNSRSPFLPLQAPDVHVVHIQTCRQNTHIENKISTLKNRLLVYILRMVSL